VKLYIGIDPGNLGAMCKIIDGDLRNITYADMDFFETDRMARNEESCHQMLTDWAGHWTEEDGEREIICTIEEVNGHACVGVKRAFTFGRHYQRLLTAASFLNETLEASVEAANLLAPHLKLKKSQDGPADAFHICRYGAFLDKMGSVAVLGGVTGRVYRPIKRHLEWRSKTHLLRHKRQSSFLSACGKNLLFAEGWSEAGKVKDIAEIDNICLVCEKNAMNK